METHGKIGGVPARAGYGFRARLTPRQKTPHPITTPPENTAEIIGNPRAP